MPKGLFFAASITLSTGMHSMTPFLIKYALPVVIGYIMFVGISGRLWPFQKPRELSLRPAWFLGIWTAVAVALSLGLMLSMTYYLSPAGIRELVSPTLSLLIALLLPGFVGYYIYRQVIRQEIESSSETVSLPVLEAVEANRVNVASHVSAAANQPAETGTIPADAAGISAPQSQISGTGHGSQARDFDDLADFGTIDLGDESVYRGFFVSEQDLASNTSGETPAPAHRQREFIFAGVDKAAYESHFEQSHNKVLAWLEAGGQGPTPAAQTGKAATPPDASSRDFLLRARQIARKEYDRRLAAEQRLSRLRKSLLRIEADQVQTERKKAMLKKLEAELQATRKQLNIAKSQVEKQASARSKALQAAQKALSFARNANNARAHIETELKNVKKTLKAQTRTTSSLINALEKERTTTRRSTAQMAARMVVQDRAIQAMKSGGKSGGKRRLIQKVAKPRVNAEDTQALHDKA